MTKENESGKKRSDNEPIISIAVQKAAGGMIRVELLREIQRFREENTRELSSNREKLTKERFRRRSMSINQIHQ